MLFKVKKNSVFLFGVSFFVVEIFLVFYYANVEVRGLMVSALVLGSSGPG